MISFASLIAGLIVITSPAAFDLYNRHFEQSCIAPAWITYEEYIERTAHARIAYKIKRFNKVKKLKKEKKKNGKTRLSGRG